MINCGGGEPRGRIVVFGGKVEDPSALHAGVQDVEYDAHDDNSDRHGAVSLEQERVDERAVQVVELEEPEKDKAYRIVTPRGA